MGSLMMHLYIGERIKEKYKFGNNFLVGILLPDIYKATSMSRMASHYLFKYKDDYGETLFLPDLVKYMNENSFRKDDEVTIGYYAHLVADYAWFRYFTGKFVTSVGFENGEELFTYDFENNRKKHTLEEFQSEIHKDYLALNEILYPKIRVNIEELKNLTKNYLNEEKFNQAIDRCLSVDSKEEGRPNLFVTENIMNSYLDESVRLFDEYYKKFLANEVPSTVDVAISKCYDYTYENVLKSFDEVLGLVGNLDNIDNGSKVAIKTNLVAAMSPEAAGTTHPNLLKELCKRLLAKNCEVVVGDSPAGPYNSLNINKIYKTTGLKELEEIGVKLNDDFSTETVRFPGGKVCHEFPFTSYLNKADYIIDFCKLKSHGMMGMSCAVKNFFGVIPGTIKPEFHFRFPNYNDFANMLIDLNEYCKPSLCIVDGIMAMEGNGPTAGVPKHVGLLLASKNQYQLDLICARIIGLEPAHVPTIEESIKRGLTPENYKDITTNINVDSIIVHDFDTRKVHKSLWFDDNSKFVGRMAKRLFRSKPKVKKTMCIGCQKCMQVCPAKAISMKKNLPVINRKKCIKCFCCQEFCPQGAMKVKRTLIARLITK